MTLSLAMIVKNEEEIIERCLKSSGNLFDEIIIVDTGSTDKTKEICSKYTNKIYDFKWVNDFSKARNFSFDKATSDYVMWLDADDVIDEKSLEKLKKLKNNLTSDSYMLKYNISFDNNGNPTFSYYRQRIMKNDHTKKWHDPVHEYLDISTNAVYLDDIAITHKSNKKEISYRNLNIYKDMIKNKIPFSPRNLYYYGRELYDHGMTKKAIATLKKFLDTKKGWIEDNLNAYILISNCYKMENNFDKALNYLFNTFNLGLPRKKILCLIGNFYVEKNEFDKAIFWYESALLLPKEGIKGFYEIDYEYFLPYLNLCLAYFKIGDIKNSYKYHLLSKEIKPENHSVIYNENYFKSINIDNVLKEK
jgi:glycosyltransferase involved in cell wall biosynthesis